MTLTARNNCFKGGIFLAALSLGLIAIGGFLTFSGLPAAGVSAALRSRGIIQKLTEGLMKPSAYVPLCTMAGAAAYSLVGIILVYHFFEKTQSPEILFIGLFMISLAFECMRIIIPLKTIFSFPAMYLNLASRILFFGRYFGLFSLFAAAVYASGLNAQRQENVFLALALIALFIALNIPVDSLVWDSTFALWNGYASMLSMVEAGILVVTIVTFLVSAYTKGSRSYIFAGAGAFLMLAGRNILLSSDTWITPLPALAILAAGTWFTCSRLRGVYLWM